MTNPAQNKGETSPIGSRNRVPPWENKANPDPLSWRSADRGSDRSILSKKENG